jgi:peptidoglycan hydrolase CwlO-like protein
MPTQTGGQRMCLTNTVHLIDFDNLSPQQQKKLDAVHKKMKARRDALQKRVDELDEGIEKLQGKRRSPKKGKR